MSAGAHRDVTVAFRHVEESGQTFTEPHGDLTVHVDGERFKALLQSTHGVVFKSAGVFTQVHSADLRKS